MKNARLVFILVILVGFAHPAWAEKLNDETIRTLYAKADADVKNGKKVRQFIKDRFDENFVLRSYTRLLTKGKVTNKTDETKNKDDVLAEASQTYQMLDIQDYKHDIETISYSADGKYAYVHDLSVTKGALKIPAGEGHVKTVSFVQKQSGVDTLTVVGKDIHVLSTDRDTQIEVGD